MGAVSIFKNSDANIFYFNAISHMAKGSCTEIAVWCSGTHPHVRLPLAHTPRTSTAAHMPRKKHPKLLNSDVHVLGGRVPDWLCLDSCLGLSCVCGKSGLPLTNVGRTALRRARNRIQRHNKPLCRCLNTGAWPAGSFCVSF